MLSSRTMITLGAFAEARSKFEVDVKRLKLSTISLDQLASLKQSEEIKLYGDSRGEIFFHVFGGEGDVIPGQVLCYLVFKTPSQIKNYAFNPMVKSLDSALEEFKTFIG